MRPLFFLWEREVDKTGIQIALYLSMKILLSTDQIQDCHPVELAAEIAGVNMLGQMQLSNTLEQQVISIQPDVLVIYVAEFSGLLLSQLKALKKNYPLPVVLFTPDRNQESIDMAVDAGVTSYVVDCDNLDRFKPLLDVAKARFHQQHKLEQELDKSRQALADRKLIDKAKGILMEQKNVSEEEAYVALRKLAMDKNKRIGEIAEQFVQAAEMLM